VVTKMTIPLTFDQADRDWLNAVLDARMESSTCQVGIRHGL